MRPDKRSPPESHLNQCDQIRAFTSQPLPLGPRLVRLAEAGLDRGGRGAVRGWWGAPRGVASSRPDGENFDAPLARFGGLGHASDAQHTTMTLVPYNSSALVTPRSMQYAI